jgi:hypothetical protein
MPGPRRRMMCQGAGALAQAGVEQRAEPARETAGMGRGIGEDADQSLGGLHQQGPLQRGRVFAGGRAAGARRMFDQRKEGRAGATSR